MRIFNLSNMNERYLLAQQVLVVTSLPSDQ